MLISSPPNTLYDFRKYPASSSSQKCCAFSGGMVDSVGCWALLRQVIVKEGSYRASDLAYPDDCGIVPRYREIVTEPVILLILMSAELLQDGGK